MFVLDIGDPQVARNGWDLDNPFDGGQLVVYYEPERSIGARIIAQQSVFVACNPHIPAQYVKSVAVPQSSKGPLQDYLWVFSILGLSGVLSIVIASTVPGEWVVLAGYQYFLLFLLAPVRRFNRVPWACPAKIAASEPSE